MVDKFSQVAGNVPVTNNDPNRRYTVINGYPVVLNFAKEPNPGVFERVRDILLATSYTKKTQNVTTIVKCREGTVRIPEFISASSTTDSWCMRWKRME